MPKWKLRRDPPKRDMFDDPALCICGRAMTPQTFKAWDHNTGEINDWTLLSCSDLDCPTNIAEYCKRQIALLESLTPDQRQMLGLLFNNNH